MHPMTIPETCAYCGAGPVYESCWTDNNLKTHTVWLCANCDTLGLQDLMDYYEADLYAKAPVPKDSTT